MRRSPRSSNLSTKRTIKLVVAYDGHDFCGWAAQNGLRTVHSTLKDAVRQVSGEEHEIIGASRTDSGAHALGQVCHFVTSVNIPDRKWKDAINRVLPPDVSIKVSKAVPDHFHSRFSALKRHYRYRILNRERDPHRARFTYYYWLLLDVNKMAESAKLLRGEHDFRAFSEEMGPGTNTVREIYDISVKQSGDEIWIDVVGTAFIRGMMRRIAGCLLEVGRGKRDPSDIEKLLNPDLRNNLTWPIVLPANGLTLQKITYGVKPVDHRKKNDFNELVSETTDDE